MPQPNLGRSRTFFLQCTLWVTHLLNVARCVTGSARQTETDSLLGDDGLQSAWPKHSSGGQLRAQRALSDGGLPR